MHILSRGFAVQLVLALLLTLSFSTVALAQNEPKAAYGILIDNTGSMRSQFDLVINLSKGIVEQTHQRGPISLFPFKTQGDKNNGIAVVASDIEWTQDKFALDKYIDSIYVVPGQTNLKDGINTIAEKLNLKLGPTKDALSEKTIFLITDGEDRSSRISETSKPPILVSFPTQDGGLVYANLYGKGDRGVVLAHGGRFNKESWDKQAPVLVKAGFSVLAIDFRGRGKSRGGPKTRPDDDGARFDVLAAIRYLRKTGAKSVSVVGASFGGGAAAEASVETAPGEIDRLILLAHSPIQKPEQMKGRKLFILSRDDFSGDNKIPRLPKIREQYERAASPKELVILEGSAHAQFIFATDQGGRLMREILRFLSEP